VFGKLDETKDDDISDILDMIWCKIKAMYTHSLYYYFFLHILHISYTVLLMTLIEKNNDIPIKI
jgi:hypothetical protein